MWFPEARMWTTPLGIRIIVGCTLTGAATGVLLTLGEEGSCMMPAGFLMLLSSGFLGICGFFVGLFAAPAIGYVDTVAQLRRMDREADALLARANPQRLLRPASAKREAAPPALLRPSV
jgi:hypothetical protein